MWRGGCIIRSAFLGRIKDAFDRAPGLDNLLLDPYFAGEVDAAQAGWRRVIATAVELGVPVPAYSTALAFYDGYRSGRLPANLIQAQRDYFGAHTYERTDKPRGEFFIRTGRGAAARPRRARTRPSGSGSSRLGQARPHVPELGVVAVLEQGSQLIDRRALCADDVADDPLDDHEVLVAPDA